MGFRQWVPRQERLGEFPHNIAQSHSLRERMSNGTIANPMAADAEPKGRLGP